ncbi:hypothetical protein COCSUDRAFT_55186 [Coccomyxa subellipsoidea C-169]|uniref:Anaphase-promoting complex subunit 2 n=1 Tax=Coccomyxa subellipsoidea (strain C-169) TaxID=574566 RepID=I0Z944_COCSC|nr:hypothetical protein COCSUDRAFT_55186 [Coccomyxa subellipsoidea C-169]EIE27163.1 hypothetical protein COCSUDRAFT_55186 [Coccomyxa subellipsoidea C-169]|eukprot:XP_005651707.1 hypothetical protein COCSUDRAFT_55186 [Coccomyxa subellipsoidea C-169]
MQFWERLSPHRTSIAENDDWSDTFTSGLRELTGVLKRHCQLVELLSNQLLANRAAAAETPPASLIGLAANYRRAVGAAFASSAPVSLAGVLEQHYTHSLEEFSTAHRSHEEGEGELLDSAEELMGAEYVERLQSVTEALELLGLEEEAAAACMTAVGRHVRQHLKSTMQATFSCSILDPALAYVDAVPLPFLQMTQLTGAAAKRQAELWAAMLGYFVYDTVGAMRIAQFFDMVVDWPDSLPALRDVKECLAHTNLQPHFISSFRTATQQRLLHAGMACAATLDILTQYVNTIKALKEVDPRGILLTAVGEPIKAYLRGRPDTIRCIVHSLTDDNADDSLFGELTQPADEEGEGSDDDVEDWDGLQAALEWKPDPVEVGMIDSQGRERSLDIISMLVGIYGSKELFINEYRSLLAEKLLGKTDYECDREIRTLELLKLRFGEANLHNCEVMLKDVADSKRVNGNIKDMPAAAMSPLRRARREAPVAHTSATIISALFWPTVPEEKFAVPPEVQEQLDAYAGRFFVLKTPRKLLWRPDLGAVSLTLTVGDDTLDLTVTPLQAAILMQFRLAHALGLSAEALRARIMFWINQGVIAEARTAAGLLYTRCESLAAGGGRGSGAVAMEEDDAAPTISRAQGHALQEMAVYEQFVMGMLTNFDGGLALDRIHNMLKMFVVDPPYDKSAEQLATFLGQLVADEKLSCEAGVFRKR